MHTQTRPFEADDDASASAASDLPFFTLQIGDSTQLPTGLFGRRQFLAKKALQRWHRPSPAEALRGCRYGETVKLRRDVHIGCEGIWRIKKSTLIGKAPFKSAKRSNFNMYLWAETMVTSSDHQKDGRRGSRSANGTPRRSANKSNTTSPRRHPNRDRERASERDRHKSPRPSLIHTDSELGLLVDETPRSTGIERTTVHSSHGAGTSILVNILRALLARGLFIVHSLTTIWMTADVRAEGEIWTFALISISIIIEGSHVIVMRAGDERKWFSPSVLLYVLATAPPIWLLEHTLCEWRLNGDTAKLREAFHLQLLEQLLLVVLIVGRWLLPKGEISREQLSQILLAYLAISSDIVELFDVFKEKPVYSDKFVQYVVLSAWTLSLLQFPFVLTVSRARKMRVAITEDVIIRKTDFWSCIYDIDLWAILLANSLQDMPFLAVRLFLVSRGLLTYTMAFFICKNGLIIALQTYRAFVLFNDRYLHPGNALESTAAELYTAQTRKHQKRGKGHRREKPKPNPAPIANENAPIYGSGNNNRRSSSSHAIGGRNYGSNNQRSPHRRVYRNMRTSIDEE
uniref:Transmembrane protein 26 n=1 Tax=Panagrellus redivivus TaxID=6233 RepID=A0A7E4VL00_PANRE